MKHFLLDTGILVHYVRRSPLYRTIEVSENLTSQETMSFISVVPMGEIFSFAKHRKWGLAKLQLLKDLFRKVTILDINRKTRNCPGCMQKLMCIRKISCHLKSWENPLQWVKMICG